MSALLAKIPFKILKPQQRISIFIAALWILSYGSISILIEAIASSTVIQIALKYNLKYRIFIAINYFYNRWINISYRYPAQTSWESSLWIRHQIQVHQGERLELLVQLPRLPILVHQKNKLPYSKGFRNHLLLLVHVQISGQTHHSNCEQDLLIQRERWA